MTQLQRVLDSAAFVNAPILSRFLRYVVERSLAHDGCALKEYTTRSRGIRPWASTRASCARMRAAFVRGSLLRDAGRGDPILIEVPKATTCHSCAFSSSLMKAGLQRRNPTRPL